MSPFPQPNSVLIIENYGIHKCEELRVTVKAKSMYILFFFLLLFQINLTDFSLCSLASAPPYSPDLNIIEESFSARK